MIIYNGINAAMKKAGKRVRSEQRTILIFRNVTLLTDYILVAEGEENSPTMHWPGGREQWSEASREVYTPPAPVEPNVEATQC